MLRSLAAVATLALSSSSLAGTITATATGTLVSATLDGTSINGASFTWTIAFDDSAYTNIGGTNYWNSFSQSSMEIAGHGTVDIALKYISPLNTTFRTYVGSGSGFTGFNFSNTPTSGTNWTNATSGNFGSWDATITGSYNISAKTFSTAIGTLVIADSDFTSFTSGSTPAVPGIGAVAGLAGIGLAGRRRRR
jgi:MYXO-CTERM domain-containing protein